MAAIIIFIGMFLVVLYDARLLRRRNEALYQKELNHSAAQWAFFNVFFLVFALPIYLLRRRRIKNKLTVEQVDASPGFYPADLMMSDALGVILTWTCCVMFIALLLELILLIFPVFTEEMGGILFTDASSSLLMIILIYMATRSYFKGSFWYCIGFGRRKKSMTKIIFVSILVGVIFAFMASYILFSRKVQPTTPLSQVVDSTQSPSLLLMFIGVAVLFAPFFEEIVFRGYFFHVLSRYKGTKIAFLAISLLFGFLHVGQYWGDWEAIGMVGLLGFALTTLRLWSGTTVAGIITHYVYNTSMVMLPVVIFVFTNPAYFEYQTRFAQLDFAQKEELLHESIDRNPDFAEAYNDLAWTYAEENKNLDEALVLVEKALAQAPESHYYDTKAEILFRMGKFKEAIAIEEKLVQDFPQYPFFREQLKKFKEAFKNRN